MTQEEGKGYLLSHGWKDFYNDSISSVVYNNCPQVPVKVVFYEDFIVIRNARTPHGYHYDYTITLDNFKTLFRRNHE